MDRVIGGSFGATVESGDGPEQAGLVVPAGQAAGAAERASPVETVQAIVPAAGAPQMVVGAVTGDVFVIHVDGRQGQVQQGDALAPGDVVLTRGDGGIEVRLANGTTAFFDHDSRILVESPDAQSGSAQPQFFVIQGQFSINAQGVAADPANSLLVRTPVSTVTVRGSRLLGKAAPEAQANTFVMLPASNGAALGTVAVATAGALVVLDAPMQGLQVLSMFRAPSSISDIDVQTLIAQFSPGVLAYSDIGAASDLARAEGPTLLAQIQGLFGIGQAQAGEVLAGGAVGDGRGEGEVVGRTGDDDLSDRNIDDEEQGNIGEDVNEIAFDGDVAFSIANGDATLTGGDGFDKATIAADPVNANIVTAAVNEAGQIVLNFAGGTNSSVVLSGVEEVEIALGTASDNVSLGDLSGSDLADDTFIVRAAGGDDFVDGSLVGRSLDFDGGEGNDTLLGSTSDDLMVGGTGNDVIAGGGAGDVLQGEAGDDVLNGGTGDDLIAGGDGIDTADFSDDGAGVTASLLTGTATGVDTGTDTLTGIENLTGGTGDDSLTGDTGANALSGGIGDDTLVGSEGDDTLDGGADTDTVDYSTAATAVSVDLDAGTATGDGTDSLVAVEHAIGSANSDTLSGTADDNLLVGNAGNDLLSGQAGDDTLQGGTGDDSLSGGDGNDSLAGGDGNDTADFSAATGNLVIDLTDGTASGEGVDTLSGFERVVGGAGNDSISGTSGAQTLEGGAGDDTLNGRGDDDVLFGGDGIDRAVYGTLSDVVVAEALADGSGITLIVDDEGGIDTISADVEQIQLIDITYNLLIGSTASDTLTLGDDNNLVFGLAGFDVISSGAASDSLFGGNGADTLFGGAGEFDVLFGEGGDDVLVGGAGDDFLIGGSGTDRVVMSGPFADYDVTFEDTFQSFRVEDTVGTDGLDIVEIDNEQIAFTDKTFTVVLGTEDVFGLGVDETVAGGDGDEFVAGMSGDDVVAGGGGDDFLFGGTGNDTLAGNAGGDTLDGGVGVDTADYSASATAVSVDLGTGAATGEGNDSLTGIEVVIGSANADALTGDAGANTLLGGAGNDTIAGGDGDDSLDGGAGADIADFASATADLVIDVAAGTATGQGTDTLIGFEGATGGSGNDSISGGITNDVLTGGAGDDSLIGNAGNDTLDGGAGVDTADYSGSAASVSVNLLSGTASGEGNDSLIGIEVVVGSANADALTGDGNANTLFGGLADDTLSGAAGDDTLIGGDGIDTADFSASAAAVTVDLAAGTATGEGTDSLSGIEAVTGSAFDDSISGDDNANTLTGGLGNDTLAGRGGADSFSLSTAASGNDSIDGGDGTDSLAVTLATAGNLSVAAAGATTSFAFTSPVAQTATTTNIETVSITGSTGNDTITATDAAGTAAPSVTASLGTGNDLFDAQGWATSITVDGGTGNDTIRPGEAADSLNGGGGTGDVLDISFATNALSVVLTASRATGTDIGTDTVTGFETVIGGGGNDTLVGNNVDNLLVGGDGDDCLVGANGSDTFIGGLGNDTYDGSDALVDVVDYSASVSDLLLDVNAATFNVFELGTDSQVGTSIDGFIGGAGNDTMIGNAGVNRFDGGGGDDSISAAGGNDRIFGSLGNDTLDGGTGIDDLDYSTITTTGVNVNLVAGTATGPGDAVIGGFENVTGTALADTIAASDDANVIVSGAGSDLVLALGGDDDLTLGDGDDTVDGGIGADTIRGDAGNDSIAGGDGADSIFGAQGNDTIAGGEGADTISGGNDADLIDGGAGNDSLNGDAGNDTVFGGIGDDQLAAVSGLNALSGDEGNDTITGGSNADIITGGIGGDVLTGNAGNDTFRYDSALEGGDTITDFAAGADRFSILGSAFSNVASTGGVLDSSAFRNIAGALQDGTTDIGNAATFVFDTQNSVLHFDPDGTGGQASFEIATVTVASGTLQASDFEVR